MKIKDNLSRPVGEVIFSPLLSHNQSEESVEFS
ncbi:MAG: hypothetical protein ACI9XO_003070, partial [Paraglaciecola sp.]